jgi:hypothetical protein
MVLVILGPSSFISSRGFLFSKGDEVEVTGSRVKTRRGDSLIAREVIKAGKILTLRDKTGVPEWAANPSGTSQ